MAAKASDARALTLSTTGDGAGFRANFVEYVRAGYQALYVPTYEENRVEAEIVAGTTRDLSNAGTTTFVCAWDAFEGITPLGQASTKNDQLKALAGKCRSSEEVLRLLAEPNSKIPARCIFILRDMDDSLNAMPTARRGIRSLCEGNRLVNGNTCHTIVILSPSADIHPKLRSALTTVDFSLPNEQTLDEIFGFVQEGITSKDAAKTQCSPALREKIVGNLLGLTGTEAENTLALCIVRHDGFCEEMMATIKNGLGQRHF